ncbi:hypothetical protein L3Q82_007930 [Scortum barcoo]|uniref:Uncharacterized protein n=1 Tax=Scortum barcoo TaxID=214431 RepID=A0ACB8WKC1_9TELE|nr:hypothetical protein L3Q82_007930 [Scortum barcoo]
MLLDTDASDWGIGAVLSQVQGGEERLLAYGSRRLSVTEQNYCTSRRELLAAVEFTSHFRQYLLGRAFTLRTDHSSLRWYGAPLGLHSNQGTNFESAVFQGMGELLGIDKTRTTPFHPQSDGQVECFNATLQKILAATAERCHWDWDLINPYVLMAYRATRHSSTGLTPNTMLFGKEITEPIDLVAGLPPDHDSVNNVPEYVMHIRDCLELSHQLAREALGKSVKRAKRHYNKNICQIQHKVGDAVWYLVKGTKRVKNQAKVVHHDKLKPYYSRTPLDNSWVCKDTDTWAPVEVSAPQLDADSSDTVIGPLNIWDTASRELAVETPQGHSSPPRDTPSTSQLHHEPPQPQVGETGAQHLAGGLGRGPLLTPTPFRRPQRLCRALDKFGDWDVPDGVT